MLTLHYPSRLGKLLIVNAGSAVYYLWQAVSLLLAPVGWLYLVSGEGTSVWFVRRVMVGITEGA